MEQFNLLADRFRMMSEHLDPDIDIPLSYPLEVPLLFTGRDPEGS